MDDLAVAHVHRIVARIVNDVSGLGFCQANALAYFVDAHSRNTNAEVIVQRIDESLAVTSVGQARAATSVRIAEEVLGKVDDICSISASHQGT